MQAAGPKLNKDRRLHATPAVDEILISAVLPVYNEAGGAAAIVSAACATPFARPAPGRRSFSSTTARTTAAPACSIALAAEHPQVRVVHLSRNFGHQAAVQAGLAHAAGRRRAADGQRHAGRARGVAAGFLLQWQAGYDVVYAVRSHRQERFWKRCCSPAFIARWRPIANTPIPVDAGNFSLMDARVVREIVRLGERDRYLPGLRSWVGFKQTASRSGATPATTAGRGFRCGGLWRLAKTAIFSFSTFPLADVLVDRLLGPGASSSRLAATRCSAGCLPTWRCRAGLRTC